MVVSPSLSFVAIVPLLIILVAIVGITALGWLLLNPNTRTIGAVLLVILPCALAVFTITAVFLVRSRVHRNTSPHQIAKEAKGVDVEEFTVVLSPSEKTVAGQKDREVALKIRTEIPQNIETNSGIEVGKVISALHRALVEAIAVREKTTEETKPPAKRPAWLDVKSGADENGDYQVATVVGPYTTRLECDHALTNKTQQLADDYIAEYLRSDAHPNVKLGPTFLADHVIKKQWQETVDTSVGPMIQLYALLKFDRLANDKIKQNWRRAVVRGRIIQIGTGVGALLAVLTALFAYLKMDLATDGTRRGRLKFLTGTIILVVVTVAFTLIA